MRFDTWVLQTVWARLANNCRGVATKLASRDLNPLYSFLNHVSINTSPHLFPRLNTTQSCDPNAEDKDFASTIPMKDVVSAKSSTRAIIAKRQIKKGEEIFISYLDEEKLLETTKQRKANLKWWLPRDCQCSRCLGKSSYSIGEATSQISMQKSKNEISCMASQTR